jgi:nitrogen fixation protein FixH
MSGRTAKPFELNGWHVLFGFIGFFGAVIAIDAGMAVQAYRTFPGEVSATPFEDGVSFNHTLAERAEERALGWRAKVQATVLGAGDQFRSGRVRLRVLVDDKTGQPVRGLKLAGRLERPATEAGKLEPRFTETRPGVYEATAPDTPGAWDLTLTGQDAEGRAFEAQSRLIWR